MGAVLPLSKNTSLRSVNPKLLLLSLLLAAVVVAAVVAVVVIFQLSKTMRLLWSGKWAVLSPYNLVFAVWRFMPCFRCYRQQDAQELLAGMMDVLHEELKRGGVPGACELTTTGGF